MNEPRSEKVGIVVIHGVGETEAGWIDTYLVPEVEKWSAYDRVAGLARKDHQDEKNAKGITGHELVISARASDDKWIAVALDHDDDFAAFSKVIGLPWLPEDERYKSRDSRRRNRDLLVSLISAEIKSAASEEWLERLRRAFVPSTPAFRPESVVNRVRDPKSSHPGTTWKSFTRHWPLPGREVIMTEMFWADLSHGRGQILARLSSLIELFLEAPFVLGRAFLSGNVGRLENMIRKLILASNWIMRWPIAGLNASIFTACFAAMALQQFDRLDVLPLVVIAALLTVAVVGLLSSSHLQHRRPGLADIGLASFVAALGLAVAVAVVWALGDPDTMRSPPTYLAISIRLILFFWFLWTALNVAAVILVSLVGAKRWIERKLRGNTVTLTSRSVPLARPAAAVGLGVLIGIVWKLVLSVLGILVIANLGTAEGQSLAGCANELSLIEIVMGSADVCQMTYAEQQLINVRDLNIAAAICVALSVFLVVRWRKVRVATYQMAAFDGTLVLPRLIAHPLIIATLFLVAVVNAGIFYILPIALGAEVPVRIRDFVFDSGLDATLPPALGLVLFAVVLIYVAESSDSDVHIGRDLVDHQYFRDPGWGSVKLQAVLSRFVFRVSGGKWGNAEPDRKSADNKNSAAGEILDHDYRRRLRIQRRLEALIDDVISASAVDRLIFFAHSQGTVILSDYLNDHDNLVDEAHHVRESLKGVKRIDVLTIGSPLKHIYEHYYGDYEPPYSGTRVLDVDSWTNIWRVDDPIGQDINPAACSKDGMICNMGIGPGGHEDYWREADVLGVLWSLIENRPHRTMPEILGIARMPSRSV